MVAAIILLEMLAAKLKVAYPVVLVLAGLLLGFVPGLPQVKVNPDLIFFIFLPPLLFEAAWTISFKEMKKWWRMIGSFAFLVVFFTASSVALATHWLIPGFTLALGFLLGGIVSPPDAVSTGAITKFVKIPPSTSAILEGESLLNDASSLIIFRFALLAVATGNFVWQDAAGSFLWMVAGGTGIGLAMGWIFIQAHKKLPTDATTDIILTVLEPYAMYWLAEQFHASGVMAVVSGGLLMSSQRLLFLNSASRIRGQSVWESLVFILNGVVFLLIGLSLPEIVQGMRGSGIPLSRGIWYGVVVTGVLILSRVISAYAAMMATAIFRPGVMPRHLPGAARRRRLIPLILGWTGMRGVVSLAAALAIPVTLSDGTAFPYRNLILFITFVVILLTLLLQGLTLPVIIRRSRIFEGFADEGEEEESHRHLRHGLKQHILDFYKQKYETEAHNEDILRKILQFWEEKAIKPREEMFTERHKVIYLEMLESQRRYLAEANKDPKLNEEIIRKQLYQIDLEEERLRML